MAIFGLLAIGIALLLLAPLVIGGPLLLAGRRIERLPGRPGRVLGRGLQRVGRALLNPLADEALDQETVPASLAPRRSERRRAEWD